jgi:hypothetical protein
MAVPGLLQTERYARAMIEAIHLDQENNQRRLEARVLRRVRFANRENPPGLHAILDESVLRRQVGEPVVMREQIAYLAAMAELPHVTIQIVPFSYGAYPGVAGPFVLLGFSSEDYPDVAYVESRAGDLYPEGELDLTGFSLDFGRIAEAAITPEESAKLLADLLEEYRGAD